MKKQLIGFILLFLIYTLMPLVATAQFSLSIYGIPWDGEPGDSFTFTVSVRPSFVDGPSPEGQTVTLSVSPNDGTVSLSSTSVTTDSNGDASITLSTGSGSSGVYRVTATFDDLSVSASVTVGTSQPPPPPPELSISVVSGPGSGAPGESLTFTVEVRDGSAVSAGKTVTFSITSGDGNASLNPTSATTGSDGRASTTLTLGSSASGSYTVTATVGSKSTSGTATVEISPPPPRTLIMFSDNLGFVHPGDTVTFTAEVGEGGSPVQGQAVMFSVSPDDETALLSTVSATTDSNGRAQTTLTLGDGASGAYTITASVNLLSVRSTVTVAVTGETPPPQQQQIDLAIGSDPTPRGTSVTVSLSQNGNPVEDQTVRFRVTPDDGTVALSSTSGITDSNGRASTTLSTRSHSAGLYTVTATLNDSQLTSGTVTVDTAPPPPILEPTALAIVSGDNQSSMTGEVLATPFVVEVRDQNDDPMEGVTVTFAVSAGGGSLSDTSVDTDANGLAQSTLTLGSDPGTNTVTVSVEDITETKMFSAEATLPPPIPTTLILSGDNQSGMTGEALANPFVVEVRDQYGDPVAGVPVGFVISAGGGSLSDTSVDTDANGSAQSVLTLGSDAGPNTVTVSVEGITAIVTFNAIAELLEFNLSAIRGISLIHVPLRVRTVDGKAQTIESVSGLYAALGGTDTVNYLSTYDSKTQSWRSYCEDADCGLVADRMLTDDTGILASMKATVSVRLGGDALGTDGSSTLTLTQGLNLVGLPLKDSRITRVSALLALEAIADNVTVITVLDNGEFKTVGRAGDPGDIEVTGGQSFILVAQQAATVTISGDAWDNTAAGTMAAPPMMTGGSQMIGITPVLVLNGLVIDGMRGVNSTYLRVIVKNLSTRSTVTTVVGDTSSTSSQTDYRLTVVDIAGGRAAAIGDILEISVTSPDASIGVESLQYVVTVEDVRRGRVELPALVLQEIPTETELLRNYPNPFNPETWIPYRLAEDAFVTLTIYDSKGQVVRTLDMGHQTAAVYENQSKAAYWDGRNEFGESVASGVYFYTLIAGDFSATRKMVILK